MSYDNIIKKEHARRAREHAELIRYVARLEVENELLRQEIRELTERVQELEQDQQDTCDFWLGRLEAEF